MRRLLVEVSVWGHSTRLPIFLPFINRILHRGADIGVAERRLTFSCVESSAPGCNEPPLVKHGSLPDEGVTLVGVLSAELVFSILLAKLSHVRPLILFSAPVMRGRFSRFKQQLQAYSSQRALTDALISSGVFWPRLSATTAPIEAVTLSPSAGYFRSAIA
jgi:hypothetical protein